MLPYQTRQKLNPTFVAFFVIFYVEICGSKVVIVVFFFFNWDIIPIFIRDHYNLALFIPMDSWM